ncbi:uncharacterized protein LOC111616159 isoform X1 [Centruroides sculpturatus]|uniref:uncharacterized protein LOC111616159 isoform X1 n=1 Tax=Centruroides sculpturatus TaxID=218467 RepID=UPI000C6E6232|nr:uncharacterized protein LOC111616159 isoform X1 [Centruroides sculpturatus]
MDDRYYPKFIGSPGCQHGSYTFYKAFKYYKHDKCRILMLGEFFFVKISSNDDPCIGELQLLWEDRNTDQMLSSVRLYFLPEQTPLGRQSHHGEHEVIAANEKVILRLEDLVSWITDEVDWNHGLRGVYEGSVDCSTPACLSPFYPGTNGSVIKDGTDLAKVFMDNNTGLDFDDVHKERELIGDNQDPDALGICIITYPRYLRYSAMLRRLNGEVGKWLSNTLIVALGGFTVSSRNVYILFCRDFFDHEGLAQNDANCDHLAPIFKGRPRKKKPKSLTNSDYQYAENNGNKIKTSTPKRPLGQMEEGFLRNLFEFMKSRNTPIHRVPNLGFKQIDLYLFFSLVQKLGGYEQITHKKQWKLVYDELGGNPGSTSAATCTRRHYERLLLPYERHLNGEDDKPLPPPPPPRIRNKKLNSEKDKNELNQDDIVCLYADNEISQNRSDDKLYDISNGKDGELDSHDEYMDDSEEKQEWLDNIKEENVCELDSSNCLTENQNPAFIINRNGCEERERKWKEIRKKNALARNWVRQLHPIKTAKKGTLERYQQMLKDAMQQHQEPHPKIKSEPNNIEHISKTNDDILRTRQPVLSILSSNCHTNSNHSSKLISSSSHAYYLPTTEHNSSSGRMNETKASGNGNIVSVNNYSNCSNSTAKVYVNSMFSNISKSESSCSIPLTKEVCYLGQYSPAKYDSVSNGDKKNRNSFSIMSPLMHRKSVALPSGQSTFGYANEKYSTSPEDVSIHIPHNKNYDPDSKSLGYDKNNEYCQLRPSVICHTEPARTVDRKIMPTLIKDKHNSSTSPVFSSLSSVAHYKGNTTNSEESNKLILPLNKKLSESIGIKSVPSTTVNKVKMYDKLQDKCKITEITKLNHSLEVSILKNCQDDNANKHSKIYKLSRIKMEEDNLQTDKELKSILASQKPKISSCISQHPIISSDTKTSFNNNVQTIKLEAYANSIISRNSKYKYDEPYFDQPKRIQLNSPPSSCIKSGLGQAHVNYKTTPFTPIDDINPPVVLDLSLKKKPQSTGLEAVVPSPSPPKTPADGICLDLSLKRKVINTTATSPPSGIENITPPPEEIEPPLYHSSPFVVSVMKSSPHLTIPVINNIGNSKLYNSLSQDRKLHPDALSNRAPIMNSDGVTSSAIDIPSTPSPSPLPNNVKSTSKSISSYNYTYSSQSLEYTSLRSSFWSPQVTAYYIPPESKQTNLDGYKDIVDQGNLQYQYHVGPHLYPVLFKEGQTYPK